jgi:curli biogenesis system outer membrane secretion channel CsgG
VNAIQIWAVLLTLAVPMGCARPQHFVHATYDFSVVKKVAVLPLENLTQDQLAGERVRKALVAELLAAGVLEVIEPGQVNRALNQANIQSVTSIGAEDFKKLGASLGAQAFFLGSLDVYDRISVGGGSFPEVTISLRAVDASTGTIVWSATHSGGGVGIVGRLFGFGGDTMSEATQKTIRAALATLFH